jgi:hypothetical protein
MATFIHNIVNIDQAPKLLKDQIKMKNSRQRWLQFKKQISSKSTLKNI